MLQRGDLMSSYKEFEQYVKSNFKLYEKKKEAPEGFMQLGFELPDGRSQSLMIGKGHKGDFIGETADVMSFIGDLKGAKLNEALEVVNEFPLGGLVTVGGHLVFRHTILLDNVDENEIKVPLLAVAYLADVLEQKFSGGDKF